MHQLQHEVQCDVVFYNQTKGGVDTCDQMVKSMTVKRKTNRWPLIIFYRIVDFAFLTLLSYGVQYFLSPTISRRKYQMQLSMERQRATHQQEVADSGVEEIYHPGNASMWRRYSGARDLSIKHLSSKGS